LRNQPHEVTALPWLVDKPKNSHRRYNTGIRYDTGHQVPPCSGSRPRQTTEVCPSC